MKSKHIQAHMRAAHVYAECSTAVRLKVGALIVKDDRIISIGYNGMPSGWDNQCETETYAEDGSNVTLKTKPEVLHAESNAIAKLARCSESGDGATMFITHAPCMDCAKLIYQSGITQVYYATAYRCSSGIEFLHQCGISVEQIHV
jgi:dCMP deaminase